MRHLLTPPPPPAIELAFHPLLMLQTDLLLSTASHNISSEHCADMVYLASLSQIPLEQELP